MFDIFLSNFGFHLFGKRKHKKDYIHLDFDTIQHPEIFVVRILKN